MKKSQVQVLDGGAMFLTFGRMKTATLQGLSFFKHKTDVSLCPVHAIAVALLVEQQPSAYIVRPLAARVEEEESLGELDLASTMELSDGDDVPEKKAASKAMGIYAYVNRVL